MNITNATKAPTSAALTIGAAVVATLALILAIIAVARPAAEATTAEAPAWECSAETVTISAADDGVPLYALQTVQAAATLASSPAPVHVEIVAQGEPADLRVGEQVIPEPNTALTRRTTSDAGEPIVHPRRGENLGTLAALVHRTGVLPECRTVEG